MVTTIEQIEGLSQRLDKARQIVADGNIFPVIGMDGHFVVQSSDGKGFYLINGTCTCPDANQRTDLHKGWCKHKLAVELFKESQDKTDSEIEDYRESLYGPDKSHQHSGQTNTGGSLRNTHKGASHE